MDELVPGEVEGGEGGEPGDQLGGDVVELVVRQAEVGQVGQHAVILAAPSVKLSCHSCRTSCHTSCHTSYHDRRPICKGWLEVTGICLATRVIFKITLAGTLICKRKTQFFHFSFLSVPGPQMLPTRKVNVNDF